MIRPYVIRSFATLALAAALLEPSHTRANGDTSEAAERTPSVTLACAGRLAFGLAPPSFASGSELTFEASVTFGEGEILALVDPETKAVERVLYDAESTSGSLRFKDGDESTIVWTRMSGAAGPLLGQAIASDGDVATLSIERAPEGSRDRPFVLFATASASLYRGTCAARPD